MSIGKKNIKDLTFERVAIEGLGKPMESIWGKFLKEEERDPPGGPKKKDEAP